MSIITKTYLVLSGVIGACAIAVTVNNIVSTREMKKKYERNATELINRFSDAVQNSK